MTNLTTTLTPAQIEELKSLQAQADAYRETIKDRLTDWRYTDPTLEAFFQKMFDILAGGKKTLTLSPEWVMENAEA